jgi:peptidyl-tRNA hydrolase, PTH1 family
MKLIVGLGNPGREYEKTRHNAGYMVIDRLVSRFAPGAPARARFNAAIVEAPIAGQPCLLAKPTTYMNRSGPAVAEAVRFYKLDLPTDVLILVDDLYLPAGTIRVRPAGGSAGHNGLEDLERALGTQDYPRLRIGIDPKPPYMDQADYVLGRFSDEQWAKVAPALDKAAEAVELFVSKGLDAAMNKFNAGEQEPRPKKPRPESDPAAQQPP